MNRILSLILALAIACVSVSAVYAEESDSASLYDDLADFSVSADHSEGLVIDIVTDENKYAFNGDDTHLIRVTSDAEWMEYDVVPGGYFVFNTAYAPNEAISHFAFEYTTDGEVWTKFSPIITTDSVEGKWIPVHYSLKKLPEDAARIRVTFGNIGGTPWSPCIESVELKSVSANNVGFIDCVGTMYYEPTAKLRNLGLVSGYSDTEFNPGGTITRAEFSSMISRLLALSGTVDPTAFRKIFNDVDSDYWGAGAIYALYNMGVINGDENGNFNPEDNIMVQDAIKIIVSSLGYTVTALDRGGYPSGFIREASRLSLLSGLDNVEYEDMLIRGDAAVLMSNALDVSIVTQTTYGGDSHFYEYGDDTILSKYHGITTYRGEVTDVGYAGVYAENNTSTGRFMIGSEIYRIGDFDMLPYLGMYGTVYLEKNGTDYTAVYFEPSSSVDVTEIDYNDYERFENRTIYYTDNDIEKRVNLTDETKIIYNYKYLTRVGLIDELPFDCGFMKVISNRGGSADYVMIYDYETYVVSGAGRLGGVFTDKNTGAVNLELDKTESIMLTYDGEAVGYDPEFALNKGDVVNVAMSADGMIADIRISIDSAIGEIELADRASNEYVIGGKAYALSKYFINTGREINPGGSEVTIYLDINGNIADCSDTNRAMRYGYLRSVDASADLFSNSVLLQVITEDGTAETLTAVTSSMLNGERSSLSKFAELQPQLVRFTERSSGTVGEMLTATDLNGVPNPEIFARSYVSESAKFYDGLNLFGSKYQLDTATKVFIVPNDTTDITKYRVTDKSALLSDTAYNVQIFDLSDEYKAGAAVIKRSDDADTVYNYSPVCVIESAGVFVDENGAECISLTVYQNGELRELRFDSDGAADRTGSWIQGYTERQTGGGSNPFSPGEVMQFAERDGHCSAFRMLLTKQTIDQRVYFEKNLGDYGAMTAEQYYSELYISLGTVQNKFSDKIMISSENEYLRTVPLGAPVYVLNRSSYKLTKGDSTDIEQGCEVFAQLRFGTTGMIIVIR